MQYSEKYAVQEWRFGSWFTDSFHETEPEAWTQFDMIGDQMEKGSIRIIRTTEVIIGMRSKA
jgi:hypothetical protein